MNDSHDKMYNYSMIKHSYSDNLCMFHAIPNMLQMKCVEPVIVMNYDKMCVNQCLNNKEWMFLISKIVVLYWLCENEGLKIVLCFVSSAFVSEIVIDLNESLNMICFYASVCGLFGFSQIFMFWDALKKKRYHKVILPNETMKLFVFAHRLAYNDSASKIFFGIYECFVLLLQSGNIVVCTRIASHLH